MTKPNAPKGFNIYICIYIVRERERERKRERERERERETSEDEKCFLNLQNMINNRGGETFYTTHQRQYKEKQLNIPLGFVQLLQKGPKASFLSLLF